VDAHEADADQTGDGRKVIIVLGVRPEFPILL
jgi:hypothetical protein